ncbi:UDP-glycosyltransferase 89B2-like [Corylus avellana]|uniref:UDP-glycosyltransferase 89B2-like n=1 Tax=Corylus avellana TaxID=13451 RepID=UPI00286B5526|nr:UDP-glycosyltransferase 89B2-like [Corylus avellana]
MSTAGVHIVAYPYPTAGHIIPLLDLTQRLLTRGHTVTVLVTPNNLPLLDPYLSSHPSSLNHLVLPAPDTSIPPPPQKRHISNMRALRDLHYPILLPWFQSHSSPPVAILSDFFLGWTHHLACELGVPRLVFSPSGAFGMSVAFSLSRDLPKNDDPENVNFLVSLPRIPNSPVYPWWQVPLHYRNGKEGDPDWEFYRNNMLANTVSWGFVFNSFAELEHVYFEHLKRELGNDRVWAVGPVLPPEDGDLQEQANRGGASSVPCHEVMTWLDSHPANSVVYVCFGSRTVLNSKQMDMLTAALELSGVSFILCVREADGRRAHDDHGVIPDGFEDRVDGRGLVIKGWAPQVAILRHRAVSAFLTHCGWNSVLEGIAAGVVMLTWPMAADQFTNSTLLVDQLGVGILVGGGDQNIPESTELAGLLRISTVGGRPERVQAKKLSDAALAAVKGGSSDQDLDEIVKLLADYKK